MSKKIFDKVKLIGKTVGNSLIKEGSSIMKNNYPNKINHNKQTEDHWKIFNEQLSKVQSHFEPLKQSIEDNYQKNIKFMNQGDKNGK